MSMHVRPSAGELCERLVSLKQQPDYGRSMEQVSVQRLQQNLREDAIADCKHPADKLARIA